MYLYFMHDAAKEKERESEQNRLQAENTEFKSFIQTLKESNTRKANLLSKIKGTKIADNELLDKWMKEAEDLDSNVKR